MIKQVDSTDCGPACLATVLAYWSRHERLYRLRDLAVTIQSGTSMYGLLRKLSVKSCAEVIARVLGPSDTAVSETLTAQQPSPSITKDI
ncbi:cysteine peptidase family C39 domain-containing protein [Deinococcus puniceus]|uniref:cysteine peptidase family C39 domain-containing protein n=1 Tax=Deinococcus puniceus TaxID=1182568 RepID=UPI0018D33F32